VDNFANSRLFIVKPEPLVFKTNKEFLAYIQHPDYELVEDRPGICWGYEIVEDLYSEKAIKDGPNIEINIFVEARDGRSPSQGPSDDSPVTS
jgi:hypothetical protein